MPAYPEQNGMSVPIARQRNRRLCEWICEYPPTVASVSQTTLAFSAKTTKGTGFGTGSSSSIDEQTIDLLIAKKIKNKVLITNRIETFEIVSTKQTGFSTDCDEDVIFNGKCETNDKFFWNGSSSTLYIDGNIETREACITLNGSRLLSAEDTGRTIGLKFNYWNSTLSQQEIGWFGYDPLTSCFRYLLDVTIDSSSETAQCYPCQVISGTPGDICTDTFIAQNLRNKSIEEQDLNIISDQAIDIDAVGLITMDTTTGAIISNTGNSGIDIISSDGNIDITSNNAEMNLTTNDEDMTIMVDTGNMEICVEDGDLDICVSGSSAGQDLNLTSYNESAINMISNKDDAQSILIQSTAGGIDITAEGAPGEDIDVTNNEGSINLTSNEAVDDAICLQTPNGGMCIDTGTVLDIGVAGNMLTDVEGNKIDSVNGDVTENYGNNYDVNVVGDTTFDTNNFALTVTDDFTITGADKEDFRTWIPYKTFDVSCGYWQSFRDDSDVSGCPVYYWRKVPRAETVYLNLDLVNPFRKGATDKGFKLTGIYFAYEIETTAITSFIPKITLKTFDPDNPGTAVILSSVTYTDGNLLVDGLTVDEHYRYVAITTPTYLNTESVINIEIELVTPADSVFKFYGAMIHYTSAFY